MHLYLYIHWEDFGLIEQFDVKDNFIDLNDS